MVNICTYNIYTFRRKNCVRLNLLALLKHNTTGTSALVSQSDKEGSKSYFCPFLVQSGKKLNSYIYITLFWLNFLRVLAFLVYLSLKQSRVNVYVNTYATITKICYYAFINFLRDCTIPTNLYYTCAFQVEKEQEYRAWTKEYMDTAQRKFVKFAVRG